ncbi:unnamed protein product [Withania somnifera]
MPGLGKTTLARKVFTHHFIDKHFGVRAWCSISKVYNLRKVIFEILKQVVGNMDGILDGDMPDKLRKRYFIVLDDICEVEASEELRLSFPDDKNGSRIVLTTRDGEVARQLKHHGDPYFLRFLTVNESWELIQKKAFQGEICPPELLRIGLQVAKSCKGLPLVIVLIAGIIAKQRQASLWRRIAEDLKDYKFPVSDLLNLWIAENFVHNLGLENMEEASKICLNDLVNRSLGIVSERREDKW